MVRGRVLRLFCSTIKYWVRGGLIANGNPAKEAQIIGGFCKSHANAAIQLKITREAVGKATIRVTPVILIIT